MADLTRQIIARWDDSDPKYVPLLKEGGITAVLGQPTPEFAQACKLAGVTTITPKQLQFLNVDEIGRAAPDRPVALTNGLWPGVSREPSVAGRGDETVVPSSAGRHRFPHC